MKKKEAHEIIADQIKALESRIDQVYKKISTTPFNKAQEEELLRLMNEFLEKIKEYGIEVKED